ncbi:MAG: biopolymer transporter ExbD [bacterium]
MAINSGNKSDTFDEINITPLTDIFLVLLIIMMVMAPTFQAMNKDIKMPKIKSGTSVDKNDLTVSVTKEGNFFINSKKVSKESLTDELKQLLIKSDNKTVVVQADTKAKSGNILSVMHSAQDAGFEKLTVAGQPLSEEQANKLQGNNINTQAGANYEQ